MVVVGRWAITAWKTATTGGGWRAGGPSSIDNRDDRTRGATGIDDDGMGRATATGSASASSATDRRGGV